MTTILLSTYNGEAYLREQLDSLLCQTVPVRILVRDDGSTDETLTILEEYKNKDKIDVFYGDNVGVARSFFALVEQAPETEYYAFCDQDDVWDTDKIECALKQLSQKDDTVPLLYMGATQLVDAKLQPLKRKSSKPKKLMFGKSLIESAAVGCTYVFNTALVNLIKQRKPSGFFMHDWFMHKLAVAVGETIYDPIPHMKYRQHGHNVIGGQASVKKRFKNITSGKSKGARFDDALVLEKFFSEEMDEETKKILNDLTGYKKNFRTKWRLMFHKKIRPTKFLNRQFFRLLVLMGRL